MSFIDKLYAMYCDGCLETEDDAVQIVVNILQNHSKEHIMQLINEMNDDEIMQMMGTYLIEMVKIKMIRDGKITYSQPIPSTEYH